MTRKKKEWHNNFIEYMEMIVNHKNYSGLPIKRKSDGSLGWIATKKSEIGQSRIEWCDKEAAKRGLEKRAGIYADIMLSVHPTKSKVCQTCGKSMSLYYHYPNANFLKALNKEFNSSYTECDHISDIWDDLIKKGIKELTLATFLISKGDLTLDPKSSNKEKIISELELICRKGGKKLLGPGAMSNFPDRYDGFHTYNRCCRSLHDKGRSKENLKTYGKDRRAYEYWSGGNIHAANQFMNSKFFKGTSADHIGPISLGFVHDPRYLQPMLSSDNSSKRDRLQLEDIEKIITTYNRTNIYPMSWYSKLIWEHIKTNYATNKTKIEIIYHSALKQNMSNFMYILWYILENCNNNGISFLENAFLKSSYECFNYSYTFNELGDITSTTKRHFTDRNKNEYERHKRIALDSVYDYKNKTNRNLKPNLTNKEKLLLKSLSTKINNNTNTVTCKNDLVKLVEIIQYRIIKSI